jgi:hypothetical protein
MYTKQQLIIFFEGENCGRKHKSRIRKQMA